MQSQYPQLIWHNETTFHLTFDDTPSEELTTYIGCYQSLIFKEFEAYIADIIPSYREIMIVLNSAASNLDVVAKNIQQLALNVTPKDQNSETETLVIEVDYSLKFGVDLPLIAESTGLSISQIIDIHSAKDYTVCALGFAPGFPYLGFIDDRLIVPRKTTPSLSVAAGSIAIAHNQTGIYPRISPGGWHVIGRTQATCFDYAKSPQNASLFRVGMRVRFKPVNVCSIA